MKKCPYCKSEMQEEASFCLYCMKSLSEKKDVTPAKLPSGKPYIIAVSMLTLLAVLIAALLLLKGCPQKKAPPPSDNKPAESTSDEAAGSDSSDKDDIYPPCYYGHDWEEIKETVHYEETGHTERTLVRYDTKTTYKCAVCYKKFEDYNKYYSHFQQIHIATEDEHVILLLDRYTSESERVPVYEDLWVVDTPAYDEEMTVGYRCKACGTETDTIPESGSEDVIASFDDIVLRATFLTGKNGLSHLWDPDSFILTHKKTDSDGDMWEIYSPDVYLNGVYIGLNLCEGGEEILTSVTGVTDENLSDALLLCECLISSVYNYSYDNLTDLLTDRRKYPLSAVEDGISLAALAEINDPESSLFDTGHTPQLLRMSIDLTEDGTADMFYDLRTRTYEGKVYYDIFFLHSRD